MSVFICKEGDAKHWYFVSITGESQMKKNRVLTVELRLIDVEDDQYEACKELTENLAKDLHAAATLLTAGASKPKVYHYGESYRVDVGKEAQKEEQS